MYIIVKGFLVSISFVLLTYYFVADVNYNKVLNSLGLCLDIFGVVYVVYELFPFVGQKNDIYLRGGARDTNEYTTFKEKHLKRGLTLIIAGFFCQLLSNWQSLIILTINFLE